MAADFSIGLRLGTELQRRRWDNGVTPDVAMPAAHGDTRMRIENGVHLMPVVVER